MIDIETCDNIATAAIMSIGGVAFDPTGDGFESEFYILVDPKSCMDKGLSFGKDTMEWWAKQEPEAKRILKDSDESGVSLDVALRELSKWFLKSNGTHVWAHGASFDIPILEHAYRKCGMDSPWKFWNIRCTRTIYALAPDVDVIRHGTYHNALDDAKYQVRKLQKICREN
jgi:hypothetical protein